ncbi:hypothetical protein D9M68_371870 [compost metagenome]
MFAPSFPAGRVGAVEALEQAWQAFGGDRRALVLDADPSRLQANPNCRTVRTEAQGIVQQVGQHPPQHAAIAAHLHVSFALQADFPVLGQRRVELQQRIDLIGQLQRLQVRRQQTVVGLGQQEHVVDHRGETLEFLQIAVQGFAVVLQRARARQHHLGLGQQAGERCAQFVGDVRGEARQALEGVFQAGQHRIQFLGQAAQFDWQTAAVQPRGQRLRRDVRRRRTDPP